MDLNREPTAQSASALKDGKGGIMSGSVIGQVTGLFRVCGIKQPGKSRHRYKAEARDAGARTTAEIAALCPITGYMTLDTYREVVIRFGEYIRKKLERRWDIEATTADDVWFFLEDCIGRGVALRTWRMYASALCKLELALTMYAARTASGRTYDFRGAIDELRPAAEGELDLDAETREYEDPVRLIAGVADPCFNLAARLQHEGGARIREAALVGPDQLLGTGVDEVTGRQIGRVFLTSVACKGGREREIKVSLRTYEDLSEVIRLNGELRIDHDRYRYALKKAAEQSGQKYNGSHGLRYCFAQRRLRECRKAGMGEIEAMLRVAVEMGHSRPGITAGYTGKTR
jgi:integrase